MKHYILTWSMSIQNPESTSGHSKHTHPGITKTYKVHSGSFSILIYQFHGVQESFYWTWIKICKFQLCTSKQKEHNPWTDIFILMTSITYSNVNLLFLSIYTGHYKLWNNIISDTKGFPIFEIQKHYFCAIWQTSSFARNAQAFYRFQEGYDENNPPPTVCIYATCMQWSALIFHRENLCSNGSLAHICWISEVFWKNCAETDGYCSSCV